MKVEDPVCKMTVPLEAAVAEEEFGGWSYFFCSEACHANFLKAPDRYASQKRFNDASAAPTP